MRVLKFGGSSVANAETITDISKIVVNRLDSEQLVCVFSAFQGITNQLLLSGELAGKGDASFRQECQKIRDRHLHAVLELCSGEVAKETEASIKEMLSEFEEKCYGVYLIKEFSPQTKDFLVSFGERLSCTIIHGHLKSQGIECSLIDSRECILTNSDFTDAKVNLEETYSRIDAAVDRKISLHIVPGFIGSNDEGVTTTLGRGGSDYTAALFAHALKADAMEKWTDVSGMMTADPRIVKAAHEIEEMSYQEAMELCHFGAKVIYPPTIHPLMERGIPIHIRNSFDPTAAGTIIHAEPRANGSMVKGLSSISGISLITISGGGMVGIPGFSRRFFTALSMARVNVVFITQASSEHSITVGIQDSDVDTAVLSLNEEFAYDMSMGRIDPIDVEEDQSIVALVGDRMREQSGVSGKAFHALGKNGVNIRAIAQGSTERNISIVLSDRDVTKALNVLHEGLFEEEIKRINLFLVGLGNVGGTLLKQITEQKDQLVERYHLDIRLSGIANSRKMLLDSSGIDMNSAIAKLEKNGVDSDLASYARQMIRMNLRNAVFVDNTASADVSEMYADLLQHSIAVVASNKIAASSELTKYRSLKSLALKRNTQFLYETNVGAGLPIIDTVQQLIKSGDEILGVKGVLSGSLNYIFNHFNNEVSFSEAVRQAGEQGLTEPDPRIDLSGVDVQRKILILAREAGHDWEMADVNNNEFLPEELMKASSVDEFLKELPQVDDGLSKQWAQANSTGKRLRYVASFDANGATVSLEEVDSNHPFYQIDGKDNIVMIHTRRYQEHPLVIKGAGAGAEVTSMGVFADIMKVANG
jgi:aspartokinase/homoserine dehydrogenase 1